MTIGANFIVLDKESTPDVLVIRDIGPRDRFMSVTNDVEDVIERLRGAGHLELNGKRRLMYYDSEGNLDEIVIKDGRFERFAPGPHRRDPARDPCNQPENIR